MCITIFALTRAEWCLCTHAFSYCWENACISIHFHMAWTDMELVTLCLHALLSCRLIWKVCAALCCDNNVHLDLVLRGNWIFFNGGGMNGRREEINSICKQWALLQNRPALNKSEFFKVSAWFSSQKKLAVPETPASAPEWSPDSGRAPCADGLLS